MSKIFISVFTGVFIGAVIYELLNRLQPEFVGKVENLASRRIDELLADPKAVAA